jgi:hypothetical protein
VNRTILLSIFLCVAARPVGGAAFDNDVRPFLQKYCAECHGGKKTKGGVNFVEMQTPGHALAAFRTWETAIDLLKEGEMPPDAAKQPDAAQLELIYTWYQRTFVDTIEAHPGYFKPRRLSAGEYRNTLRTLFGFDLEVAVIEAEQTQTEKSLVMKLLPTDPPGKSGFRNDTHGNPLTPTIWDQYSYLSDLAINRLFTPARSNILDNLTGPILATGVSAANVERFIRNFLPQVFRRPLPEDQLDATIKRILTKTDLETSLKREIKSALMSPTFLYRGLSMTGEKDTQRPVDDFELAERMSYFLWGDMPDDALFRVSRSGKLRASDQIRLQVNRMLDSPRAHFLAEDFSTQWLALDAMDQFATRQVPTAVALKTQPIEFIRYLIREDRPILELLDTRTTFANALLAKFYVNDRKQITSQPRPKGFELMILPHAKIELKNTPERGGLLTMPGILAMNHGPIQRGTWMLERILGEHLPDPPPDVGPVQPNRKGENLSFRQRFEQHRENPTCAVCHSKIDPLGFALQAYDDSGLFKPGNASASKKKKKKGQDYDSGAIDTSGQLPNGSTFQNFAELKQLLVSTNREAIVRNIVERMLSYALCRKLEIYDQPALNEITKKLTVGNGTWRQLIHEVVNSLPFRETVVKGSKS